VPFAASTFIALAALLLASCGTPPASRDHTPPTAQLAAYPSSDAAPLSVRFDATGSRDDVGVARHQWSFGDGQSGSGAIVNHVYTSQGAVLARLIASDVLGNQGSAQQTIRARAPSPSRSR